MQMMCWRSLKLNLQVYTLAPFYNALFKIQGEAAAKKNCAIQTRRPDCVKSFSLFPFFLFVSVLLGRYFFCPPTGSLRLRLSQSVCLSPSFFKKKIDNCEIWGKGLWKSMLCSAAMRGAVKDWRITRCTRWWGCLGCCGCGWLLRTRETLFTCVKRGASRQSLGWGGGLWQWGANNHRELINTTHPAKTEASHTHRHTHQYGYRRGKHIHTPHTHR